MTTEFKAHQEQNVLAESYAVVFDENDQHAARVIQDLGKRFGYLNVETYIEDERNAGHNCIHRAGQSSVLKHILRMVNRGKS